MERPVTPVIIVLVSFYTPIPHRGECVGLLCFLVEQRRAVHCGYSPFLGVDVDVFIWRAIWRAKLPTWLDSKWERESTLRYTTLTRTMFHRDSGLNYRIRLLQKEHQIRVCKFWPMGATQPDQIKKGI